MLLEVLERKTGEIVEVVGRSPCGNWKEESFLVGDLAEDVVLNLAKRYGQRGVFKLTDELKIVVTSDGEVRSETSRHI